LDKAWKGIYEDQILSILPMTLRLVNRTLNNNSRNNQQHSPLPSTTTTTTTIRTIEAAPTSAGSAPLVSKT
jgi:hypothetical protein